MKKFRVAIELNDSCHCVIMEDNQHTEANVCTWLLWHFFCFYLQCIISMQLFLFDCMFGQQVFKRWCAQGNLSSNFWFYAATDFLLFLKSYRYILSMHALACLVPDVFATNFVVWAWDSWGIPHFFQKLAIFLYHLLCHGHSQAVSDFSTVQKMMLPKVVHFSTDK